MLDIAAVQRLNANHKNKLKNNCCALNRRVEQTMKSRLLERSFFCFLAYLWLGWFAVAHAATPPAITGVWPATATPGTIAFVFGSNFSLQQGGNKISYGGVTAPVVQPIDSNMLFFIVPAGGTDRQICISTSVGSSCFDSTPMCSGGLCISGFWPADIKAGGLLFVFGSGFTFPVKVTINGVDAPLLQILAPDLIFILIPPGVTNPSIKLCDKTGNCVCFPSGCFIIN